MKNNFKNKSLLAALALTLGLGMAAPQKSEASVMLGKDIHSTISCWAWGLMGAGAIAGVTNRYALNNESDALKVATIGLFVPGFILGVLDADGSLSSDALSKGIMTTYSFLDDTKVADDLSGALKAKFKIAYQESPNAQSWRVALLPEETLAILKQAKASINPEQAQTIVVDLQ